MSDTAAITRQCPNDWHRTAPARARVLCPECPTRETDPVVCRECSRPVRWSAAQDDWTADDGTACGGDVTYDGNGDPVIGHHVPVNR